MVEEAPRRLPGCVKDPPSTCASAWPVLRRAYNCRPMHRAIIERRLRDAHQRLARARTELDLLDEQLIVVNEIADDTRVRALVAETPLASKEHDEATRQAAAMVRNRQVLVERIAELERRQDELLDRLVVGPG
jgi:hypothetical protein